jgi:hypothetical protein
MAVSADASYYMRVHKHDNPHAELTIRSAGVGRLSISFSKLKKSDILATAALIPLFSFAFSTFSLAYHMFIMSLNSGV